MAKKKWVFCFLAAFLVLQLFGVPGFVSEKGNSHFVYAADTPETAFQDIKINFQPKTADVPLGYIPDYGEVYGDRNGYSSGWNVDHSDDAKVRGKNTDQRLDTLCLFHYKSRWEIAVPNGNYNVLVNVGDPGAASNYTIYVEGVSYWNNNRLSANKFLQLQKVVSVTDGRLTVEQGNALDKCTRINYIEISAAPPDAIPEPPAPPLPVDTDPPTVPANVYAAVVKGTSISLKWDASTDNTAVKGYEIYNNGTKIGTPGSTSYTQNCLAPGTTYTYTVKAYDWDGNYSEASSPYAVSTLPDTQPPSSPEGLTLTTVTDNSAVISWQLSSDDIGVKGYQIYRDGVKIGSTSKNSYKNTGLKPAKTYVYTLKAYDFANNYSPKSEPLTVVTNPDITPPSVPAGVYATGVTATSVALKWSASTDNIGVKGYTLYRNGINIGTVTKTVYQDTGLNPAMEVTYTLNAFDEGGNVSELSLPLIVSTSVYCAPPTGLKVTSRTDTSVSLCWTASPDSKLVQGYEIYRDGVKIGTTGLTRFNDAGLTSDTTYNYTVKSYDEGYYLSEPSSPLAVTTCLLISQDTVWSPDNGPYIIEGGLIIAPNTTLYITSGVVVKLCPGTAITIKGTLNAADAESGSVVFTCVNDPAYGGTGITGPADYWETINITPTGGFDGNNVKISYGNKLINVQGVLNLIDSEVSNANTSGITVTSTGEFNGTNIKISNCCNLNSCIGVNIQGTVNLSSSEVTNCPGTGILVAKSGTFYGTLVKVNSCNKGIDTQGTINLVLSEISNCDYGIYFNSDYAPGLILNSFIQNKTYGLYNNKPTSATIDAANNYWGSANGPSTYDDGSQTWIGDGDRVSSGVSYSPWLENPNN